ncbi:TPA: Slp family lipoprotein [Yersinia enterocolitica]|uniref:Slp family lipoprotein n=1 Tax=Yersinia enterocolitica TaxID=630 RepID=UPI0033005F62|nr:Slp family lipoprotein [Yersinia enterocolitica]EKN4807530.1 Slp family lipoprotein [Yersinia enterocolitica]HDL7326244.1 Slp family lipoprotein [Yersinia enterocolitica]HDL7353219.1 Slp family lipoprotein [Yersinia enterocolitica]HDL7480757.1 Slp family lipoprotein [Yersinia enterocolitica]
MAIMTSTTQSTQNKSRKWKCGWLGLGALLLSGCVTIPPAIQGTTATPQQNLNLVRTDPKVFIGQEARFGGTVINVTNEARRTRLEIASVPLDSGARPILGEPSQGRVIAYVNGFLEPVDFRGHLVTVVGPITGVEAGKIGQTPYDFVVMNAMGYKRWHIEQQVLMPPMMDPWGYRHPGMWGPGWGGWYNPGPAPIQTIVTE